MSTITGFHHLSLTVTDRVSSAEWYCDVLGFSIDAEIDGATFRRTRLRHPDCGVIVTLTQHDDASATPFDERRSGLDHVAFLVPDVAGIRAWKQRLQTHGVDHSEVKPRGKQPSDGAMITFRDPDNIQIEVVAVAE